MPLCLLLCFAAQPLPAQLLDETLARMDRFARTFSGAQATIRTTNHVVGVPDDDKETGSIFIKRSSGKTQFLIRFTQPNIYTAAVHDQVAEVYHPKLNEIQEYDIRAYKDVAQKLFLLGFGMPGKELAANYEIRNLKRDMLDKQTVMFMQLIPKSPEVLKQLKSVDLWISDVTQCPLRQVFHLPDGSYRMADFSEVEVNPKFAPGTFELPKGAKRVKVN